MTPRMRQFLEKAAECKPGKGFVPDPEERQIAGRAVSRGYGIMIGMGKPLIFIINENGRYALRK